MELEQFSGSAIDEGVNKTMIQKANHIFHGRIHPKPHLIKLSTQMGGESNVIKAALQELNGIIPAAGAFERQISLNGLNITVRGFVRNGIPVINTMF